MALRHFRSGVNLARNLLNPLEVRYFSSNKHLPQKEEKEVNVVLVKHDGTRIPTKGKVGESLLDLVVNNNILLDGYGACEGTLTCSTCHVILKQSDFDSLPDRPSAEEGDMLELANENCSTSRLGCQVYLSESMNNIEILVPEAPTDQRLQD